MNKRKLELYEDLFKKVGPGASKVTIGDIASAFKCSDRHARTLLKQMSVNSWLTWHPIKGRGQKGELYCHIEPILACYQAVDIAIEQEKYEQAHQLVGFNGRDVASGLKHYLGRASSQSEETIYAPFHRKLGWLHPHHSMERTERHLIHEVFQTLVTYHGSELKGELAHHWESDIDHRQWIFHLRLGTTFHDHSPVTAADVVESLKALTLSSYWQRLYDHINLIEAVSTYCVAITLKEADPCLPYLLSRAEASIMPHRNIYQPEGAYAPIGSGPFIVDIHSNKVLRLKRNNHYNGRNALIEQIEIWIHPQWALDKKCAENFFFLDGDEKNYKVSTTNIGYFFILINHRGLQTKATKHALLKLLESNDVASFDLPFPISFSYENNNDNRSFATALMNIRCPTKAKPSGSQVVYGHALSNQDLAIGGIRLEGDRATSLFAFFKLYPYWDRNLTWKQHDKLRQVLQSVRRCVSPTQREGLLDSLLETLYDSNVLAIIKSEDLILTVPSRVRSVEINSIGWCNFAKLWIDQN